MSNMKIRDIAVKVGEYQDHNTGGMKGRFENDKDVSHFAEIPEYKAQSC